MLSSNLSRSLLTNTCNYWLTMNLLPLLSDSKIPEEVMWTDKMYGSLRILKNQQPLSVIKFPLLHENSPIHLVLLQHIQSIITAVFQKVLYVSSSLNGSEWTRFEKESEWGFV